MDLLDVADSGFLLRGGDVHISRASDAGRGIPGPSPVIPSVPAVIPALTPSFPAPTPSSPVSLPSFPALTPSFPGPYSVIPGPYSVIPGPYSVIPGPLLRHSRVGGNLDAPSTNHSANATGDLVGLGCPHEYVVGRRTLDSRLRGNDGGGCGIRRDGVGMSSDAGRWVPAYAGMTGGAWDMT